MSAWTSSRTMRTTSWSISERDPYAWSLTPAFQLTTQKLEGAGRVILIGPGACSFRYAAWSPVSRRRGRSRPPTTLDVLGSARAPGPRHATVRPRGTQPADAPAHTLHRHTAPHP